MLKLKKLDICCLSPIQTQALLPRQERVVIANQAHATRTQLYLPFACPIQHISNQSVQRVVQVCAQPLYKQTLQLVARLFVRDAHNVAKHLVELLVRLVIV